MRPAAARSSSTPAATPTPRTAPNLRHWFRGTAAHNTVSVDGLDQTPYRRGQPRGPVAEGAPPRPATARRARRAARPRPAAPRYDAVPPRAGRVRRRRLLADRGPAARRAAAPLRPALAPAPRRRTGRAGARRARRSRAPGVALRARGAPRASARARLDLAALRAAARRRRWSAPPRRRRRRDVRDPRAARRRARRTPTLARAPARPSPTGRRGRRSRRRRACTRSRRSGRARTSARGCGSAGEAATLTQPRRWHPTPALPARDAAARRRAMAAASCARLLGRRAVPIDAASVGPRQVPRRREPARRLPASAAVATVACRRVPAGRERARRTGRRRGSRATGGRLRPVRCTTRAASASSGPSRTTASWRACRAAAPDRAWSAARPTRGAWSPTRPSSRATAALLDERRRGGRLRQGRTPDGDGRARGRARSHDAARGAVGTADPRCALPRAPRHGPRWRAIALRGARRAAARRARAAAARARRVPALGAALAALPRRCRRPGCAASRRLDLAPRARAAAALIARARPDVAAADGARSPPSSPARRRRRRGPRSCLHGDANPRTRSLGRRRPR